MVTSSRLGIAFIGLAVGMAATLVGWASAPAGAATRPAAPSAVGATLVPGPSARVTFTPGADGGSPITGFTANCISLDGGTARSKSGSSSPIVVPNLTIGTSYYCRVRATNAVGAGPYSSFSPFFDVTATVPAAPTLLNATLAPGGSAKVTFTPGPDGGSPVTTYTAQCTSLDGGTSRAQNGPASPITVPNLTVGKTYYCRVRAVNAVGIGPYSPYGATFVIDPTVPAAPTSVSAVRVSATSGKVTFAAAADGGSAVIRFTANCQSTDGGTTRTVNGSASPVTVGNLTTGSTYRCRVRATNGIGPGPYSAFSGTFVP